MQLRGAVSLVTGAGSGLGLATAERLASLGSRVVLLDLPGRRPSGTTPPGAVFTEADITDPHQVRAAVELAQAAGELRVVVNCAGRGFSGRILGREGIHDLQSFADIVHVNIAGTFNVLCLAARAIAELDPIDGERGVIVNTASVAAFDGQVGQVAYACSKAGVAGLTLPAARDLASALIRVVAIAPGAFDTPMLGQLPEEKFLGLAAHIPHPSRLGRPEEFAALVAHVVENPMLNGEVIRLDGALRLPAR